MKMQRLMSHFVIAFLLIGFSTTVQAELTSIGLSLPVLQIFSSKWSNGERVKSKSITGGTIYLGFSNRFGLGIEHYASDIKSYDATIVDDIKLTSSFADIFWLTPIPVVNVTLGAGFGTSSYDCEFSDGTTCGDYYQAGSFGSSWNVSGRVGYAINQSWEVNASINNVCAYVSGRDIHDSERFTFNIVAVGVQYLFGKSDQEKTSQPVVSDNDFDGVPDSQDSCPATHREAVVNAQGCEPDTDKDGVLDSRDKCPGTAGGIAVNAQGCDLDTDDDGIPDSLDKCPGTGENALVDYQGCHNLARTVTLHLEVDFNSNSARLSNEYNQPIHKLADFLIKHSETRVLIEGHTDSSGSADLNMKLSEERSEAVALELVNKYGIVPGRIQHIGYGDTRPIADNSTPEGRKKNRRVVAVVEAFELIKEKSEKSSDSN